MRYRDQDQDDNPPTEQPQGTVCPECKSAMGSASTWRYVDGHYEHRCKDASPYMGHWRVDTCSNCLGRGYNLPSIGIAAGNTTCAVCKGTGVGNLVNKPPQQTLDYVRWLKDPQVLAHGSQCPVCRGTGKIPMMHSIAVPSLTCETCDGRGTV